MNPEIEIKHLKLSKPALRALNANNITILSQLVNFTENELLSMHGIGHKTITTLTELLKTNAMTFRK